MNEVTYVVICLLCAMCLVVVQETLAIKRIRRIQFKKDIKHMSDDELKWFHLKPADFKKWEFEVIKKEFHKRNL
jgi:hypothetical protein